MSVSDNVLIERLPRYVKMRELRILLAVVEHGSFRKAGKALHVTQPVITTAIANLEHILEASLFNRTSQGVTLTIHGVSFVRHATAIFGELQHAAADLKIISSGSRGTIYIGTVPMPATGILPLAITKLLAETPNIFISVYEASEAVLVEALKTRKLDLFISRLPGHDSDETLHYESIYEDSLCIIASRSHPLAVHKRLKFDDLRDQQWVIPPIGSAFHSHIQRILHRHGSEMPQHVIESTSIPVMYGMIANGNFLAFASRSQYEFTPMKPLITALRVSLPAITAPIAMVTLRDRPPSPLALQLVHQIHKLAATIPTQNE